MMRLGTATVALLVVIMVVIAAVKVIAAEVPLVDTEYGRVSGILEKSVKGRSFHSFYGIPFARPPVGKLRFKDPEPLSPWGATRQASFPAAPCLQTGMVVQEETLGEEDCLYLNVFTPKVNQHGVLPVMVWIHGGGFFYGTAGYFRPHALLDQEVVLVVVQYRLGILGFLSTEDSVIPGNLGLKDQTMALEWVQRNIHVFGGDKTRVTIAGHSAGGASVHYQMLTPKAEGLFARAILQSGTALGPWAMNNTPRKLAHQVADAVGCPTDQGSESLLVCLQAVDATVFPSLMDIPRNWYILPNLLTPWVDGNYLPDHPAQLVLEGRHAKVDIIGGVTKDEGAFFTLPALAKKALLEELQNNFSVAGPATLQLVDNSEDPVDVARQVHLHYLGTTHITEAHDEGFMKMLSDRHFTVPHDLTTAHHAHHSHPAIKTFRYELQHHGELSFTQILCPSCDKKWVCHVDELYYLYYKHDRNLSLTPPIDPAEHPKDLQRPGDLRLREIIITLWTNFAATGNPTPDTSLGFTWEPSTAENLQYLSLTPSPSMQTDNRKEARRFHNALPTQENLILHPHLVESRPHEPKDGTHSSRTEF